MVAQIHGLERFGTLRAEEPSAVVDDAHAEASQLSRGVHPQQGRTRGPMNAEDRPPLAMDLVIEIYTVDTHHRHHHTLDPPGGPSRASDPLLCDSLPLQ